MIGRFDTDEPGNQAILEQILKDVCERERVSDHSAMADEIARQLKLLFVAGTRDRDGLLSADVEMRAAQVNLQARSSRPL